MCRPIAFVGLDPLKAINYETVDNNAMCELFENV